METEMTAVYKLQEHKNIYKLSAKSWLVWSSREILTVICSGANILTYFDLFDTFLDELSFWGKDNKGNSVIFTNQIVTCSLIVGYTIYGR